MEYTIHPIAHIRTDFTDKFGIPRQSGLVPELTARIVFEPEYRDPNALVGIEGYDRLCPGHMPGSFVATTKNGVPVGSHRGIPIRVCSYLPATALPAGCLPSTP